MNIGNRIRAVILAVIMTASLIAAFTPALKAETHRTEKTVLEFRHTEPITLDGINVAIQQEMDRRALWISENLKKQAREKEAARLAAIKAAKPKTTAPVGKYSGLRPVNWDAIARCETGGNWQHQTQFDGGLGILHANWITWGGLEFAPYGSQATREQQIIVAERMYHTFGNLKGWGCGSYG